MPFVPNKNGAQPAAATSATPPPKADVRIDSGVPLPDGHRFSQWKALAAQMKPGDSVLFDTDAVAKRAYQGLQKNFGRGKCALRKMPDGWRVWRLK